MFERFTDRARKVMALANQEAQRFSHEYIGSEHILLGLLKEGTGVGAGALKSFNIDLKKARIEVEKLVRRGSRETTTGKLPQTPRAKKVIEYAIAEARSLGHSYVGTEHLVLGLVSESDGVAAQVLLALGLRLEAVRKEVLSLLGAEAKGRLTDTLTAGSPGLSEIESLFQDHPVVGVYRRLLDGWTRLQDQALQNGDYESAWHAREQRELLERLILGLLDQLQRNAEFGGRVLPEDDAPSS